MKKKKKCKFLAYHRLTDSEVLELCGQFSGDFD